MRLFHPRCINCRDLSNNQIGMLSNNTFRNLTKLAHLWVYRLVSISLAVSLFSAGAGYVWYIIYAYRHTRNRGTRARLSNAFLSVRRIISYNKLQCVQRGALAGLKSLRIMYVYIIRELLCSAVYIYIHTLRVVSAYYRYLRKLLTSRARA